MPPVYWIILSLMLGLCIGSFLNVVIYRLPRDLSVSEPRRSFCPACRAAIAWYDNIPVLSYLLLRGRCRRCHGPISLQYPLVELATGLVFVLVYDTFFISGLRDGIGDLSADWPMLVAHWALFAGMIALAVMDLEEYMIDIQVTHIVSLVGIVAHALWTPPASTRYGGWIRPGELQAGFAVAASLGFVVAMIWYLRRQPAPAEAVAEGTPGEAEPSGSEQLSPPPVEHRARPARWGWLILAMALVIGYIVLTLVPMSPPLTGASEDDAGRFILDDRFDPTDRTPFWTPAMLPISLALALCFAGLSLAASLPHPEADAGIQEDIAEEAHSARDVALAELYLLAPAILLACTATVAILLSPEAAAWVRRLLNWRAAGEWRPLLGLSTGLAGWVLGGAVGWLSRIVFTLVFGKEALGMGDVHILAAAGAVAGWPVAFIGFFAAAPLALLGMVVIRLRRQSRILPYGPWLALGFLVVMVFQDRILRYLGF